MHILHVACMPFPTMQGSQVYLKGLLRAQSKRHRVALLCYGYGLESGDEPYEIIRIRNVGNYRRMRAGPDVYKPILDVLLAKKLWGMQADVIHVHNYEAPIAAYIRRIRKKTPIVYTAHNTMEEELPTYWQHRYLKGLARRFGKMLDYQIPKRADVVVAIRPETESNLRSLGCHRVYTILPGVEELAYSTQKHIRPTVMYAGNVDAYQNLGDLIELAKRLSNVNFRLVTSQIEGFSHEVPPNVCIVETSDFQKVCEEISQAHIFLVPRKICSGFPMKILNALALGVPVVTYSSTAPLLKGTLYCQDIDDMEVRIRHLLSNVHLANLQGVEGREFVLSEYMWENSALKLDTIYNMIKQ